MLHILSLPRLNIAVVKSFFYSRLTCLQTIFNRKESVWDWAWRTQVISKWHFRCKSSVGQHFPPVRRHAAYIHTHAGPRNFHGHFFITMRKLRPSWGNFPKHHFSLFSGPKWHPYKWLSKCSARIRDRDWVFKVVEKMTSKSISLASLAIDTYLVCPHHQELKHWVTFWAKQSQNHMGRCYRKKCGLG